MLAVPTRCTFSLNRPPIGAKIHLSSSATFTSFAEGALPVMSFPRSHVFALTAVLSVLILTGPWATHAAAPAVAQEKAAPEKKEKRIRLSDTTLRNTLAQTV